MRVHRHRSGELHADVGPGQEERARRRGHGRMQIDGHAHLHLQTGTGTYQQARARFNDGGTTVPVAMRSCRRFESRVRYLYKTASIHRVRPYAVVRTAGIIKNDLNGDCRARVRVIITTYATLNISEKKNLREHARVQ